ncbi:hypothetical protein GNF10_30560 [Nostoc sp. UCD121]|uniref:hypothetical protein n=1 Tax=unclassified Nostoc TaxID=2593658 RepID=UPI001629B6D6|nr:MULTISPECIES: hypothetical protein [unclassified Nostoc]MBC1218736.1 hypothetical protein [Nostoc sp. UCD120]MBC1280174.1 hypothetical protein [Nostoc sp. UCD121]MBC1297693.1 hypothetical protein [Nostoc sp. UCD122]
MDKQESLQDKFGKLFNNMTSIPKKLADAVEEGLKEPSNLVCVQEGLLNFDLIEEDARRIQGDLKARGDRVLGSNLILDYERKFMEIRTYIERGDKNFVIIVDAEVKRATNTPSDILHELKEKGRVELSLKL